MWTIYCCIICYLKKIWVRSHTLQIKDRLAQKQLWECTAISWLTSSLLKNLSESFPFKCGCKTSAASLVFFSSYLLKKQVCLCLILYVTMIQSLPHLWESRRGFPSAWFCGSLGEWWSLAASSSPHWRRWAGPASACRSPRSPAGSPAQSGKQCECRRECVVPQL